VKSKYREKITKQVEDHRSRSAALESEIAREKLRDPLDRGAKSADDRRKKLRDEIAAERADLLAQRDHEVEETAKRHPIA
jgi:hypothetical protein